MSVRLPRGVLGMLTAFIGLVPVAASAAPRSIDKGAVTYKWTDEQGIVHYGDSIPPQYAQKERTVLNSRGVEVRKLDAQKTPEQLATADRTQKDDFRDIPQAIAFAEKIKPDGVLTITSDRAVVAVASVAEALGLPGIGVDVALGLTNKIEMRRRIDAAGLPQPRFGGRTALQLIERGEIERVIGALATDYEGAPT